MSTRRRRSLTELVDPHLAPLGGRHLHRYDGHGRPRPLPLLSPARPEAQPLSRQTVLAHEGRLRASFLLPGSHHLRCYLRCPPRSPRCFQPRWLRLRRRCVRRHRTAYSAAPEHQHYLGWSGGLRHPTALCPPHPKPLKSLGVQTVPCSRRLQRDTTTSVSPLVRRVRPRHALKMPADRSDALKGFLDLFGDNQRQQISFQPKHSRIPYL